MPDRLGAAPARPPLALWGGVECTVNRVGDHVSDQFDRNGHAARLDDLDRFAALGLRTLRTSVLWERVAPDGLAQADWRWPDASLGRMRTLGVMPIVGLVHHGSGPRTTSLVDPGFAGGLAGFASAVAQRYPDVEAYTPVNEPLTTARFSGLYGHWYPHGRSGPTFARALLTQVQATVAAMEAVRRVNPAARLVQTEDLGRTWSTPARAAQAAHDNERRWLTWDLLWGRVDREHPFWEQLVRWGIGERELDALVERPCPPDVVGVNHYLTSERFLDDRLDAYPPHMHGDGGVDVEAIRVVRNGPAGLSTLLVEAAERYGCPIAVTEAHLGCTREEQVRWLVDVWAEAERARAHGADVRAVTVWALLGAYDWDSLLTERRGHYEPGAFDVRSDPPRPTALAHVACDLAGGRAPVHPVLDSPGWWKRPFRFGHPPMTAVSPPDIRRLSAPRARRATPRPLLLLGDDQPAGAAALRLCGVRGLAVEPVAASEPLSDAIARTGPWAVVDALEVAGAGERAERCARAGVQHVVFSSAHVFTPRRAPWTEADRPSGTAQADDDHAACAAGSLVVRTEPWFCSVDPLHWFRGALATLAAGRSVVLDPAAPAGVYGLDAVHAALDLLVDGETGVWHLVPPDTPSAADLLRAAASRAGLNPSLVYEMPQRPGTQAVRLASVRGTLLDTFAVALDHFFFRDAAWEAAAKSLVADPAARHAR